MFVISQVDLKLIIIISEFRTTLEAYIIYNSRSYVNYINIIYVYVHDHND